MIKNKTYLIIAISSFFLMQRSYAMDDMSKGISRRQAIPRELPEINQSGAEFVSGFDCGVLTYKDDVFVQKFLALVGQTSTMLDERDTTTYDIIRKSIKVKAGKWHIGDEDKYVSTGDVHECVAIAMQHANPNLVALYHYYQKADEDFVVLDRFLSVVQDKANQLKINISDLTTTLVSSYVSANFVIIKRAMRDKAFNDPICYVRPRAYLAKNLYAQSQDTVTRPGRLVLVSPSVLKVHQYEHSDPGNYDSDLPHDDDDCIIS